MIKKFITVMSVLVLLTATSCAQDKADTKSVKATKLSQNEMQEKLAPLFEKIEAIPEGDNEYEEITKIAKEFVDNNQNDAGVYVVSRVLSETMNTEDLLAYVDNSEYLKNDEAITKQRKVWQVEAATGEGKMFKDFSATYNGKVTKLSDYVGKGKYVLVDFWASWCGPCKREIPNLIRAYNKYKGENFEVLGVATWDKPEDTKKAVSQLNIPYPQMLNAQNAGSDAYGIQGIPQIILFGPDGKIIKRNLRGENIDITLRKIFGK